MAPKDKEERRNRARFVYSDMDDSWIRIRRPVLLSVNQQGKIK